MSNIVIHSFNGGEMSPKIDTRTDIEKYASGCRILENMIPQKYGCAERRPGTRYLETAKLSPQGVRMVGFIYNSDIAYEIEFGNEYARFFYDGKLIDGADIETPYQVEDLPAMQFFQIGDIMWIVHRNYAPRRLSRTSVTTFSLDTIEFQGGPFLTRNDIENNDGVTLTANVTVKGGSGTLTASSDVFEEGHTGALFKLIHPRDSIRVACTGTGDDEVAIDVKGTATFLTRGTWTGTVKLQRSFDDGSTWDDYRIYTGAGDRNVLLSFVEKEDNILYRISVDASISAEISLENTLQESIYRIDAVTSSTVAQVTCVQAAPTVNGLAATKRWAEGAWSMVRGYPSCIGAKDNRIVFGATNYQPSTFWLSAVDDYETFEEGVNDDDSFSLTLTTHNELVWINTLDGIVLGTTGGIWVGRSSKLDTPITPTNFNCKEYVTFGSAPIQSIKIDNAILYVDDARRKIREFTFGSSDAEYVAQDLTILAEHITKNQIVAMAFQKNPDPILWVCLDDGQLLSMTYERDQNVVAWARHPMGITQGSYMIYPTLREPYDMPHLVPPTLISEIVLSGETEVSSAEELQAINGSGHYKLTADIDLHGMNWIPIQDFSGVLDGQGHRITGLKLQNHEIGGQALFRNLSTNAQVRNIILEDCQVSGGYTSSSVPRGSAAVLCCYIYNATNILIKNITITNSQIGPNLANNDNIDTSGFIVANIRNASVDIADCVVSCCTIDGSEPNGTEYLNGNEYHAWDSGGIVGNVLIGGYDNISNSDPRDHTIKIVRNTVSRLNMMNVCDAGGIAGSVDVIQSSYGSADNNKIYIMDCSADVEIKGNMFCGGIVGIFDIGRGKYSRDNIGVIANCSATGRIYTTEPYTEYLGGCIGAAGSGNLYTNAWNMLIVQNCNASVSIDVVSQDDIQFIGGFCAAMDCAAQCSLRIYECSSSGNITLTALGGNDVNFVGGFCATVSGNPIEITEELTGGRSWTGKYIFVPVGLVDDMSKYHSGLPTTLPYWAEGVVERNGEYYYFYSQGYWAPVKRIIYTESVVSLVIFNCSSNSNLVIKSSFYAFSFGGFCGEVSNADLLYCSETGNITVFTEKQGGYCGETGGLCGTLAGKSSMFACSATGNIIFNANSNYSALWSYFHVQPNLNFYNDINFIGGAIGIAADTTKINDCYAWGNITCRTTHSGNKDNDVWGGEISGIGGFIGYIYDEVTVSNVYSIGKISCTNDITHVNIDPDLLAIYPTSGTIYNIGALVGYTEINMERSYWDYESSGSKISASGTALTTAQAKTKSSYYLWDFDYIWKMKEWGISSICVTPSYGEDKITLSVARIIQGSEVCYIEQMAPRVFEKQKDAFFVDCGKSYTGISANSFGGLQHLEGEKVKVLGDGAYVGEFTVMQGTVTLPDYYFDVHIGLPYQYRLRPMRIDSENTRGMIRIIHELYISFLNTLGARYGTDNEHLIDIDWRTMEPYTTPPVLFTGDKKVVMESGYTVDDPILIAGDDPFPCTIRCIVARVSLTGG